MYIGGLLYHGKEIPLLVLQWFFIPYVIVDECSLPWHVSEHRLSCTGWQVGRNPARR